MTYTVQARIPKDRIAVLIGEKGKIKRKIETETSTQLTIDSKEGDVTIEGDDGLQLMVAKNITQAVGRGFNPKIALQLLKLDFSYEQFDLQEYTNTKNGQLRLKGRVIGEGGKSRKTIEELTECSISVYGKTIGVIGEIENLEFARRAIDMILTGSPHRNVYKWLEKQRRLRRGEDFIG